jgi:hypothetical protein
MQIVPADVIKRVCTEVYGRGFCDKTWDRWRKACNIDLDKEEYAPNEWAKLVALAKLKRENPFGHFELTHLYAEIGKLQAQRATIDQIRRISRQTIPDRCYGSELADVILQATGRKVSDKTLYRWGQDNGIAFGVRREYNAREINWWIRQARKNANFRSAA